MASADVGAVNVIEAAVGFAHVIATLTVDVGIVFAEVVVAVAGVVIEASITAASERVLWTYASLTRAPEFWLLPLPTPSSSFQTRTIRYLRWGQYEQVHDVWVRWFGWDAFGRHFLAAPNRNTVDSFQYMSGRLAWRHHTIIVSSE